MGLISPDTVCVLLVGNGGILCALPLGVVGETMRPLPIEPLQGCPEFVAGLAVVRGEAIPVVSLPLLTGVRDAETRRFVTLRTGGGRIALAVQRVVGVRRLDPAALAAAPPLLGDMRPAIVARLGTLDGALLVVLDSGRLLPDAMHGGSAATATTAVPS